MRQRCCIELFSDYDCKICYHPGKANVVADALSRKERIKPRRVQALNMTIQSSIKGMILAAQNEASEIKDRLKAARDRQKSYADKRRKPLEFNIGDNVLLKVSPWKGVPIEILEREIKKLKRSRIPIIKTGFLFLSGVVLVSVFVGAFVDVVGGDICELFGMIYSSVIVDWGLLNNMGYAKEIEATLEIKVYEGGSQEEIFSSEAWRCLFDINERIYIELCHEFYSTYDFDEVCAYDELITKKLIKFRLCGRGHTLTLLEFARQLGLYHSDEINDEGFEVYFQGGLCSDENFNARDYWLSISSEENLHLSRILASTIRSPILRVLQKMITYGVCQRTTGKFTTRIAKRMELLTDEVLNTLTALTYCRALDATTLRELISSNGRLIIEDPALGVPRVAMPRGTHPSMHDLYAGLFEHMAGQNGYTQQGDYAPLSYDEEDEDILVLPNDLALGFLADVDEPCQSKSVTSRLGIRHGIHVIDPIAIAIWDSTLTVQFFM
ncbi:hypothetical protein Tco_1256133 [Tanacetum coccineum]